MQDNFRSIIILFLILFLVMVGFGIIIPIMPFLLVGLGGNASIVGLFMATYSLMHFLFAPYWGRLSDQIGRRPVILIGLLGYGITFVLFGLASELWMLFAIRILSGVLSSAAMPTAMAYVADVTSEEHRSRSIGLMSAAMGTGLIFGPALGGWLGQYSFSLPFFIAGLMALIACPFAYRYLPETLNRAGNILASAAVDFSVREFKSPLFSLFLLALITNFSAAMFEATFVLFAAHQADFGPKEMGVVFTLLAVIGVVIQGSLIGRLVKRFGDMNLIKAGLLLSASGLILIIGASDMKSLLLTSAIYNIGLALMGPSSSTLVTRYGEQGQGTALGIMQSFGSLGRIIGPIIGGGLYELSIYSPYIVGTVIMIAAYLVVRINLQRFVIKLAGEGN